MDGVIGRLRRPAYTGDNRCLPCTAVNLVIAFFLALAVLLATVTLEVETLALPLSTAVFLGSIVVIYLRGYLVPGTPTLTKRYFPQWLLALFGKQATDGLAGQSTPNAPIDGESREEIEPETILVDAGVLEPCAEVDDLRLREAVRREWEGALHSEDPDRTDEDRLRTLLGRDDLEASFERYSNAYRAKVDGKFAGAWESRAAFLADTTAAPILDEYVDDWASYSLQHRGTLLNGLRLFLEHCPKCNETLALDTKTVESCCSTHEVAALCCEGCGVRLFESDPL